MTTGILSHEQTDRWVESHRAGGRRIGFTCGAFDILHAGHVDYLEKARTFCDVLLVAVNSDASVRRYKDPLRPVNPEAQRMRVIAALKPVDAVTLLDDDRPLHLIRRWQPDLYIKGGDYATGTLRSASDVEAYGGQVIQIPVNFATSTSALVERIALLALHESAPGVPPTANGLVFLDRDGTLIRNVPFLNDPARVELAPGAGEALLALQSAGLRLVIVTNQQGIGLGYIQYDQFVAVNRELLRQLAPAGVRISKILFCPHSLAEECDCRKPHAWMLRRAMQEFGVLASACFLIGDSPEDRQAAEAAGVFSVLVNPEFSLQQAAQAILERLNPPA